MVVGIVIALILIVLIIIALAMPQRPEPRPFDETSKFPPDAPNDPGRASQTPPLPPFARNPGSTPPTAPRVSYSDGSVSRRSRPPRTSDQALPKVYDADGDKDLTHVSSWAERDASGRRSTLPTYIDVEAAVIPPEGRVRHQMVAAFRTSQGKTRTRYEDRMAMPADGVYALADGVGGNAGGDVASRTAVEAFSRALGRDDLPPIAVEVSVPPRATRLVQAVHAAHAAVRAAARENAAIANMASTFLALQIDTARELVYVVGVGDSRCYRLRGGRLSRMSLDHVVTETGSDGRTREVLTRALGVGEIISVDLAIAKLKTGDRFLLCTDGLHHEVNDEMMRQTMTNTPDLQEAASRLVELAEVRGRDNISFTLVDVTARVA